MMLNNRILCVDDEKDIVQAYIDFLAPAPTSTPKRSSRGGPVADAGAPATNADTYVILKAHSGEEAIEVFKKELAEGRRIAAAFFDVKMEGGIDGIQALRQAWQLDPDLHATIVTAYQDRSVQDINSLFGDRFKDQWDYLNKPFNQGEILQKARQMTAAWNRKKSLEEAHRQLIQSERMAAIGQVARGIGHEFGNILQRIVGKADLALSEGDSTKLKAHLKIILDAAERAAVIVRNLQSFSRHSAAKSPTDVSKVIEDTLSLVNHELVKQSVTIEDKRSSVKQVSANSGELQQVLMNFIINAMHAMPEGGKVEVGCAERDGAVEIWVRDSGTGISPEVLPRIFEYAFTTKGDQGSGLGLSISKQIVEGHGGTISVASEVGKGTIFTVRLPLPS